VVEVAARAMIADIPVTGRAALCGDGDRGVGAIDWLAVDGNEQRWVAEHGPQLIFAPAENAPDILTERDVLTATQNVRRPRESLAEGENLCLVHGWPPLIGGVRSRSGR